jgi:hypothetical protein
MKLLYHGTIIESNSRRSLVTTKNVPYIHMAWFQHGSAGIGHHLVIQSTILTILGTLHYLMKAYSSSTML